MKFEEFGQSPEFTNKISTFMSENSKNFIPADEKGEQNIDNYLK